MGKDYKRQTLDLKQMCLPHERRRKYKGIMLLSKGNRSKRVGKTKDESLCPSARVKGKQSTWFFLLVLVTPPTGKAGPQNILLCPV